MAIYSAGRRRIMVILLLTSVLLITLDLRGNTVFNGARTGFGYALRPFEVAAEVISRPVTRTWRGVTEYDELRDENRLLQQQLDAQRSDQIAAQNAIDENRQLRAALNLESLSAYDRVTASIIGSSPSNFDQQIEIDIGFLDGIKVGMPVVNDAGLVGKVTRVAPETAIVRLITHPEYSVQVKVVSEVAQVPDTTVPPTVPSGLAVDDVTTTSTTTTSTTEPPDDAAVTGSTVEPGTTTTSTTTTSSTTTTTTTTLPPIEVTRETGSLDGYGADRLPRVRFIADSPLFGRAEIGDAVLTAGGSRSLAPPNIPVGVVANVITGSGTEGLQLEVEPNADLGRLTFLTVVLYQPPTELENQ